MSQHTLHALTYPVYAATFDPHNGDFLFVSGGGGEGAHGVPNKITLIDTSRVAQQELREIAAIDLPRDEDSVNSLAVAHSSDIEATVFAGINSSQKEQDAGRNEHLRAVRAPYPQKKIVGSGQAAATVPAAEALSKASLFTQSSGAKKETYQRVLRLSPAIKGDKTRLGAVATGLAPIGEVVLFNASTRTPSAADIIKRISVGKNEEAGDVDIIKTGDSEYRVAYCTDGDLWCTNVKLGTNPDVQEPFKVFAGSKADGAFRSLRFLTKDHVLLIRNFPQKKGAQILISKVPDNAGQGIIVYGLALPSGFNAATALDVAALPAIRDADKMQFLVAAAGQDRSIVLYTLDHTPRQGRKFVLQKHSVFRDIHPAGTTSVAFSKFPPSDSEVSNKPTRVKLASTSFGNTVAVHVFPLKPRPTPRKATHHVLALPPQQSAKGLVASGIAGSVVIIFLSIFILAIGELSGQIPKARLGARNWAPGPVKDFFGVPREVGHPIVSAPAIVSSIPPLEPAASARAASRAASKAAASKAKAEAVAAQASSDVAEAMRPAVEELEEIARGISIDIDVGGDGSDAISTAASIASEVSAGASSVLIAAPSSAIEHITQQIPSSADATDALPAGAEVAQERIQSILQSVAGSDSASPSGGGAGPDAPPSPPVAAVLFRDSAEGLSVSTHEHESHAEEVDGATRWEELGEHQQRLWRRRLRQAGHWVEGETEKVLKGVFFGTIAGVVGAAVAG